MYMGAGDCGTALPSALFYHLAQIHDQHLVGDMLDDSQIMRNKQIRIAVLLLKPLQQIQICA